MFFIRLKLKMAVLIIFSLAVASSIFIFLNLYHTGHFLYGSTIAGVAVGGLTEQQAGDKINAGLNQKLRTSLNFNYKDYAYKTSLAGLCEPVQAAEIVRQAWNNEEKRSLLSRLASFFKHQGIPYYADIKYDQAVWNRLTGEFKKSLDKDMRNPALQVDPERGLITVAGQTGKKVNEEKTRAGLPRRWQDLQPVLNVPISVEEQQPAVSEKDLQNMGELAAYTTWYNPGDINRTHNLNLAAAAINGSMVKPGEVFSFNRIVGARSADMGYSDAMVIVDNKFAPGIGGGICQASSTLYNTCLLAGMEIVERHNHALVITYVPLGFDATVVYGQQDFKFKNNTAYPIYIRTNSQGGKLTMNLYGNLQYKRQVKLTQVIDEVFPFKEIRETDPQLPSGVEKIDHSGVPGYIIRSYRNYYDDNGGLIKNELLAKSSYSPLNKLIYVGPPPAQVAAPAEEQTAAEPDTQLPSSGDKPGGEPGPTITDGGVDDHKAAP